MGWTTITADTSWQELAIAQQIATAFNKRVNALSSAEQTAAGVSTISASEAVTVFDFIEAVQTGVQLLYPYFSDPTLSLAGQSGFPVVYSSVGEMFDAAGLTATGRFRRIADGGTAPNPWTDYDDEGWVYGAITDKDLAGPWLFKDLQSVLSVLTRRLQAYDSGVVSTVAKKAIVSNLDYLTYKDNPTTITYVDGAEIPFYANKISIGKNTLSNPDNYLYDLALTHSYNDYTFETESTEPATVSLVGVPHHVWAVDDEGSDPPAIPTTFNSGLTVDGTTKVIATGEASSGEVTIRDTEAQASWATIRDAFAWPSDPADGVIYVRGSDLRFNDDSQTGAGYPFFVIDYDFNP